MPSTPQKAFVITGPTSGIGRPTALALAAHGTVVLVGRDRAKLDEVRSAIARRKGQAVSVVCDLSDVASARRAAAEIAALNLPIAALHNNAGMREAEGAKTARGWDVTFATNYLGPFALTEALAPSLADGATVVFVASAVEDPERAPAKRFGFRGGRFLSVAASARGEWKPGGSKVPGFDAYATSKQCVLAATLALARTTPRLRFNAFEPGIIPNTGLGRDAPAAVRFVAHTIMPLLAPHMQYWSTPKQAARVGTKVILNAAGATGIYYDENGDPKEPSPVTADPQFQDRVLAETRAFLASV